MRGNFTTKNEQQYVQLIKIKTGFYSKSDQNAKTKAVVWNAIWTAMKPEKKIWVAEIEIYLLVLSNGLSGIRKIWNWSVCFRFSDLFGIAMLLTASYFNVLVFRKALKAQISCSKIDFGSKFRQKQLKGWFYDFCLVSFFKILFLVFFWFCWKFSKNKKHTKKFKNEAKNLPTVVFLLHFSIFFVCF